MPKRVVGANQGPQTKKGSWCQSRPQKGVVGAKKGPKKGCWCQGEEEMRRMYFNLLKVPEH